MLVQIQKWGKSLAIRIPQSFARQTNIDQGSFVDLSLIEGALVARPVQEQEYSLETLLAHITEENIHAEINPGDPMGKEVW